MRSSASLFVSCLAAGLVASSLAFATEPPPDIKGAIKGAMNIKFDTRTEVDPTGPEGFPTLGVKDIYTLNMEVNGLVLFQGTITRTPWVPSQVLGTTKQEGAYVYALNTSIRNPNNLTQTKAVGKWIGGMSYDGTGVFDLSNPPADIGHLRFSVGIKDGPEFDGIIQGRIPEQAGLFGLADRATKKINKTYYRYVNGKKVGHQVKGADPLAFKNVTLAQGPVKAYDNARVNGAIDYDAEESVWYLEARVVYTVDGAATSDRLSGSIRWVEDPNRKANGKGYYDVNVRLNEPEIAGTEQAAFEAPASEEDFFTAEATVPGFTGQINYLDTFEGDSVVASSVNYNIDANQATKYQVMIFYKILMLMAGPFNDE